MSNQDVMSKTRTNFYQLKNKMALAMNDARDTYIHNGVMQAQSTYFNLENALKDFLQYYGKESVIFESSIHFTGNLYMTVDNAAPVDFQISEKIVKTETSLGLHKCNQDYRNRRDHFYDSTQTSAQRNRKYDFSDGKTGLDLSDYDDHENHLQPLQVSFASCGNSQTNITGSAATEELKIVYEDLKVNNIVSGEYAEERNIQTQVSADPNDKFGEIIEHVARKLNDDYSELRQDNRKRNKKPSSSAVDKCVYPCRICGKKYKSTTCRNVHEKRHSRDPCVCDLCGKQLSDRGSMKDHLLIHIQEKAFVCAVCGRAFLSKTQLKRHQPVHLKRKGSKPSCFLCGHCGKSFARKHQLQSHERIHTGEKPYACKFCDQRFKFISCQLRHQRSHSGEKPYPCTICGKRFADVNDCKSHERIHTGEKPFTCATCGKSFTDRRNFRRHEKRHTDIKSFGCPFCGKKFHSKDEVKAHVRVHTGEKPYACKHCGKRFSCHKYRKTHESNEMCLKNADGGLPEVRPSGFDIGPSSLHRQATSYKFNVGSNQLDREVNVANFEVVQQRSLTREATPHGGFEGVPSLIDRQIPPLRYEVATSVFNRL